MSLGYVMLAQNGQEDYVKQACLCAMSIHATNQEPKIALITNDPVPEKYQQLFHSIVEIPWGDNAADSNWKVENRWKIYHATPFEKNIVLDTDMLVLQDLSSWWNFLDHYDLFLTKHVYTYRGEKVTSDYYRKAFVENELPNLYTGVHYFNKCAQSHDFYKWMELITHNWELFYGKFVQWKYPKRPSMDITAAIASKIMDCDREITNNIAKYPAFTHMKPHAQNWKYVPERWQDKIAVCLTPDLKLNVGNYTQDGIFHYTEKDFASDHKMLLYENYLGIK